MLQEKQDEEDQRVANEKIIEMQKIEQNLKNIKELESNLVEIQNKESSKKEVSTKLLTEANERLKEGIKNKDFTEIQLAQAMIEGAKSVKIEEDDHRAKASAIEKKFFAKKFFAKKSKTD